HPCLRGHRGYDPSGAYVLQHHTEVTLRFDGVEGLRLEAFNHQSVLSGLKISRVEQPRNEGPRFRVSMPSSYGMEAQFECAKAQGAVVHPSIPPPNPAAPAAAPFGPPLSAGCDRERKRSGHRDEPLRVRARWSAGCGPVRCTGGALR